MSKKQPAAVSQVSSVETAILISLLQQVLAKNITGDVVELGCYRGDTSILFQHELQKTDKILWLYDSFAGLPEKTREDSSAAGDQFKTGELFVTKREVIEKFKRQNLPLPKIKKAFFEDLDPISDLPNKICFAFLDGDYYQSIMDSLRLVTPKLTPDAVLVVDDYANEALPGAARAADVWLQAHPGFRCRVEASLAVMTAKK